MVRPVRRTRASGAGVLPARCFGQRPVHPDELPAGGARPRLHVATRPATRCPRTTRTRPSRTNTTATDLRRRGGEHLNEQLLIGNCGGEREGRTRERPTTEPGDRLDPGDGSLRPGRCSPSFETVNPRPDRARRARTRRRQARYRPSARSVLGRLRCWTDELALECLRIRTSTGRYT